VEKWEDLEDYAERCRYGVYQVNEVLDGTEIRVVAGRFGYIGRFNDDKDQLQKHILRFCQAMNFIKVSNTIPDELFFSTMVRENGIK